jgi:L-cysteine desulfidase
MDIQKFLHTTAIPATGCTEPAAIAYAASVAYHALSGYIPPAFTGYDPSHSPGKILRIEVATDRNVYKNAASAIVPGLDGRKGPAVAAAAGIFLPPMAGLDIFSGMTPEKRSKATVLALSDRIICRINPEIPHGISPDISVSITVENGETVKTGSARISGRHDHVAEIFVGKQLVYTGEKPCKSSEESIPDSIIGMIRIAESMDAPDIDAAYRGVEMNLALATTGMNCPYGLGLGKNLRSVLTNQKGHLSLIDKVRIAAAAAADARMGGAPYPVMSSAGSGNQGITALVPVGIIGLECKFSKTETARAALISHMVTRKADRYAGHLSALCGCSIKAGIGATAGVTYLIGGGAGEITTAINLMVANVTGTICDGAKPGCSLKIATAAGIATECAFLAAGGMKIPAGNGIIRPSANGTMRMLEKISHAMISVDTAIIDILEEKPPVSY